MTSYRKVLHWYPSEWRRRYGEELAALLEDTYKDDPMPRRIALEIACAGARERLHGLNGNAGLIGAVMDNSTVYRISRMAPPVMSLIALMACVLAWAGVSNPPRDEGTMAHIYQLIMVAQLPIIGFFVLTIVRRRFRRDLLVIGGVQLALLTAAVVAVPILHL